MPNYGVVPEGFAYPSVDETFETLKAGLRGRLGPGVTFAPDAPETFLAGVMAEALASLWAAGGGLWFAFDPEGATDTALDNLASLTGTERLQPTASSASLLLTGDTGTVVESGKVVSVTNVGTRFATSEAGTLADAASWAASTTYALGSVVTSDGSVWVCAVGGSSGLTGPTGTTSPQVGGGVTWRFAGPGTAYATVDALAEATGPLSAPSYTLTEIETPVAGWRGVANPSDAVLGRLLETDASLRVRRRVELRPQGNAAADAIRGRLLDPDVIDGTTSCFVFENETDVTNSDGLPPHSVEVLIEGGDDAEIRAVLWDSKAAGIRTYGTVTGTTPDASGASHSVSFSRPETMPIYVLGTVNVTPDAPLDDDEVLAKLLAAVIAYGQGLHVGRNVVTSKLSGALTAIEWVDGVASLAIGVVPTPTSSVTIQVGNRQRASLDSTRVTLFINRLSAEDL